MKIRYPRILMALISATLLLNLAGCTHLISSRMPSGSISMTQIYDEEINGNSDRSVVSEKNSLEQFRAQNQENFVDASFPRLANPDIAMYVYPHLAGNENNQILIPGYWTRFPLYNEVHYALPGE